VAGDEPVTSPDQHKPTNRKAAYLGGIVSIVILVAMIFGNNHPGGIDRLWLLGVAGLLALIIAADVVLRRNGLRD
jgi:hypothetical protein